MHVVATAGHVDHGKSSLVVRLTGIDPDRWEEEKRRGLTIDLGFAWTTLPSGREIGFVDVPGHERFVRNMLAGVGPVRLILFVVAADEGWKPQSEEHLEIVDVLGAEAGIVALTKSDLVDPEGLALRTEEIEERLADTALEGAPVVPCSSATGHGIDDLAAAIDAMVAAAPVPEDRGRPRIDLDRSFTIRGAGTVVTGTLTGGTLAVGDEVVIHPDGVTARIRSLQTHRRPVEVAQPVSRVAANLAATSREEVVRGDVLTRPGQWRPTSTIEVRLRPVRSLERPLTSRGAFKLYAGSAERDARLRLYGDGELARTGSAFARLRLSRPIVAEAGDRFVLREVGRGETVAGGVVLDPHPPARPGPDAEERLARREGARREDLPSLVVAERRAVRASLLPVLAGASPSAVTGATRAGGWWVADEHLAALRRRVAEALEAHHRAHPLRPGMEAGDLRKAVLADGVDPDLGEAVLDGMLEEGVIAREGPVLRQADHRVSLGEREPEAERLVEAVAAGEPTPPTVADLEEAGFARDLIEACVRTGRLARVSTDLVLTPALMERAEEVARAESSSPAGLTVSRFRELLGTSRKYALPILASFDARGLTRRDGDVRRPGSSA
jgi:selenocysteine-specific elongation factor